MPGRSAKPAACSFATRQPVSASVMHQFTGPAPSLFALATEKKEKNGGNSEEIKSPGGKRRPRLPKDQVDESAQRPPASPAAPCSCSGNLLWTSIYLSADFFSTRTRAWLLDGDRLCVDFDVFRTLPAASILAQPPQFRLIHAADAVTKRTAVITPWGGVLNTSGKIRFFSVIYRATGLQF